MSKVTEVTEAFKGSVPGCAIQVIRDRLPLLVETHGYADMESVVPITSDTNFRLASVTKHFTATAILELCKRDLLSLNDTLDHFFPNFPEYGECITIKQLLTHTSGLIDYEELMDKKNGRQIRDHETLWLLMQQKRGYFEPGSTFRYSDGGYCLLSLIVEQVTGKKFSDFMRSEIFAPLGMTKTFVNEGGTTDIPNRAYGYSRQGREWKRTDQNATSATAGDGGVYSSLSDLLVWDRSLDSRDLFKRQVVTDQKPYPTYYGFGFFLKEYRGMQVQYHGGSSIGFRTGYYRIPEKKVTVIFLSNRNEGDGPVVCEKVLDSLFF